MDWDDGKGFGFVRPGSGRERYFAHIKDFEAGQRRPANGDGVSFAMDRDSKGRYRAVCIRLLEEAQAAPGASLWAGAGMAPRGGNPPAGVVKAKGGSGRVSRRVSLPVVFTGVFMLVLSGLILTGRLPLWLGGFYLLASLFTFAAYAIDKSAARNNRWRTQESTLHLLSLACGWPGAIAAQRILRHKSVKPEFRRVFWLTVVLNVSACGIYLQSGEIGQDVTTGDYSQQP